MGVIFSWAIVSKMGGRFTKLGLVLVTIFLVTGYARVLLMSDRLTLIYT
jgi:hypothetical protein